MPYNVVCMDQPTSASDYYHRVVDCQWACPAHTNVPEYIRLIAQNRFTEAYLLNRESNVFPGILGRTCDRPCEPACRRTRVDGKPVAICRLKTRRCRPPRRGQAPAADGAAREERKEDRAHRRRTGVADGRQRSDAARLPVHDLRAAAAAGRADAHQHSRLPAARAGPRRRNRLHRRHGRRGQIQHLGRQPEGSARHRRVRRGLCRHRRAERERARHSRAPRHRSDLHRHRVARGDSFRPRRFDRQACADHRRRQHGDGLLPIVEAARRDRRQGHRAKDAAVLQGVAVGARRRRRRRRRDRREPAAGPLHHRERQADRDGVRSVQVDRNRRQASSRK